MKTKELSLKASSLKFDKDNRAFSGYASVFNEIDSYGDTVIPGAYADSLESRKRPVQLRWQHYGDVVGKWLEIKEDEKGLFVKGELTKGHSKADDIYALLKHGAISGLSVGYRVVKSKANEVGGEDLHEIDLVEISIVETPADLGAEITDVKTAENLKDIEAFLRDAKDFSRSDAKILISRIKKISQRESDSKKQHSEIESLFQNFKI